MDYHVTLESSSQREVSRLEELQIKQRHQEHLADSSANARKIEVKRPRQFDPLPICNLTSRYFGLFPIDEGGL